MDEVEFGRYRLFGVIGEGAMGRVYRAHDTVMGRDVAIKVLPPELAGEPGYQERFRREALTAGRLASPNVIPIYEAGEIDGRLYLVMPVVDGVDVDSVLERGGPMSPALAVRVIEQVAAALDSAHKHGLVHRDVKPSNLLMTDNESVYLIDFGIAHDAAAGRLTRTNTAVGSWAYMAPERFSTGKLDGRSDVYSLACVLYECLTGQLPFVGDSLEQLAVAHLTSEPPKPTSFNPAIPAGFDEVIARGMAKNASNRYQTATERAAAARRALSGDTAAAATPTVVTPVDDTSLTTQIDVAPPGDADWPAYRFDVQSDQSADAVHYPQTPLPAPREPTPSRNRRRVLAIALGALVAVVVAALTAFIGLGAQSSAPPNSPQIVLPFAGLNVPMDVAVDTKGNIYASDSHHNRVLELAAGSTSQTVLPFTGLDNPLGVAVDDKGNVYVADTINNRVLELAAGSTTQTVLPFTGLDLPHGVAVDNEGGVYVADMMHDRVLELFAGSTSQTELPFTGLYMPSGLAVDSDRALYVADLLNARVLKMPYLAKIATSLPFTDLHGPGAWRLTRRQLVRDR